MEKRKLEYICSYNDDSEILDHKDQISNEEDSETEILKKKKKFIEPGSWDKKLVIGRKASYIFELFLFDIKIVNRLIIQIIL